MAKRVNDNLKAVGQVMNEVVGVVVGIHHGDQPAVAIVVVPGDLST